MAKKEMSFSDALQKTLEGERITRKEWADEGVYGFLVNGRLTIRMDYKLHDWILHEADMVAEDWHIL